MKNLRNLLLLVMLVGSVALAQPPAPRHSDESQRAMLRFLTAIREGDLRWLREEPRHALINRIGQDLALKARRPIPWTFAILQDREPNAACCGEGVVYVTTGLLDLGLDADEIAGVLAHEVAHGARQHLEADRLESLRREQTDRELEAASQQWEAAKRRYRNGGSEGELEWQASQVRSKLNQVERRQAASRSYETFRGAFNHEQEREADRYGMSYAQSAGYAPDGLVRALERIRGHRYERYGSRSLAGSWSHPPIGQRIERLRELLRRQGY